MINDDKWIYKKDEKGIPTVAPWLDSTCWTWQVLQEDHPGRDTLSWAGAWEGGARATGSHIGSVTGGPIHWGCHHRKQCLGVLGTPWFSRRRFCCGIGMNLAKILAKGRLSLFAFRGVDISEQIVRIEMEVKQQPNVDALRPGKHDEAWALQAVSEPIGHVMALVEKSWYIHIVLGQILIVGWKPNILQFRWTYILIQRKSPWYAMVVGWTPHGSAGARHMAFDDLEWVSDSSFRLGDRVWAQGREATMTEWSYKKKYKKVIVQWMM